MWHDTRILNAISSALLGLAALVLLCAGLWWLTQRPFFNLKVIRIDSVPEVPLRRVNALTVRSTALPKIHGNFFTANLDTVRVAFEAVPWVRKATVRREWPNTLLVHIEEHQPLGTWGQDGRLVSVKGDVFTANLDEAEEDGELPEFDGPEGSAAEVVTRYDALLQWFAPLHLAPEAVQLSGRYAWIVRLDNGISVELGREQNAATLQDRVSRLVSVYPQLVERLQDRIESIDMRYPNGLALKASGLKFDLNSKLNSKKK